MKRAVKSYFCKVVCAPQGFPERLNGVLGPIVNSLNSLIQHWIHLWTKQNKDEMVTL